MTIFKPLLKIFVVTVSVILVFIMLVLIFLGAIIIWYSNQQVDTDLFGIPTGIYCMYVDGEIVKSNNEKKFDIYNDSVVFLYSTLTPKKEGEDIYFGKYKAEYDSDTEILTVYMPEDIYSHSTKRKKKIIPFYYKIDKDNENESLENNKFKYIFIVGLFLLADEMLLGW